MEIKVLGPCCAKCKEAEKIVRKAVEEVRQDASVEKVTDLKEMMALGVMATPAVVIDGSIKCTGRVPSLAEVKGWIAGADANVSAEGCSCGACCK